MGLSPKRAILGNNYYYYYYYYYYQKRDIKKLNARTFTRRTIIEQYVAVIARTSKACGQVLAHVMAGIRYLTLIHVY